METDDEMFLGIFNIFITLYAIFILELGAGTVIPADDECIKMIIDKFAISNHSEAEKLSLATFLYLCIHISKSYNMG